MSNFETQLETEAKDLGSALRQAREALNFSIEDVSNKINLRISILQDIENNRFIQSSLPATFMKGYVRSYAKFLKLSEDYLATFEADFGEIPQNDLAKSARSHKSVNRYAGHHRWISYITVLILLCAAGMTGLWWWENYQQSNAERDHLVENYVANENQVEIPMNNPVETVRPEEITTPAVENVTPVEINTATQTPNTEPVAILPPSAATSVVALQSEMNKIDNNNVNNSATTITKTEEQQVVNTNAELQIEVTGVSCWLSVRDKKGKVLAEKEYLQGEKLNFNEGNGYSLIVGAPSNVKITYKGQSFPLKVDGRVARIQLPQ